MDTRKVHSLKKLKEKRDSLRKNLTPAEATLWLALKNSQLHKRKFIRQHSIGPYIADFYCAPEMLIVELDGQGHFDPLAVEYDAERTKRLNELGYTVVRFENKMVFKHMDMVLAEIVRHFKESAGRAV